MCPVEVLCVGSCVYNDAEVPPIQIGGACRDMPPTQLLKKDGKYYSAGEDTGKKVALIGGGPASISAAHLFVDWAIR